MSLTSVRAANQPGVPRGRAMRLLELRFMATRQRTALRAGSFRQYLPRWAVATTSVALATVLTWQLVPGSRHALVAENGILENATFILYCGAVLLGMVSLLRDRPSSHAVAYPLIPFAALVAAAEEIGYGSTLSASGGAGLGGSGFDGLHDANLLVWTQLVRPLGVGSAVAAAAGMLLLAVAVAILLRFVWPRWLRGNGPLCLVGVALLLGAPALVFDLVNGGPRIIYLAEETLEATAGVTLFFAAYWGRQLRHRAGRRES